MYKLYYCLFENKKGYVGVTKQTLDVRIKKHKTDARRGSNFSFHQALRKYNYKFDVFVLAETESSETAKMLEMTFIRTLNTHNSKGFGYNATIGGDGVRGLVKSNKQRDTNTLNRKEFVVLKDGAELGRHYNQTLAAELYSVCQSKIFMCLNGKRKHAKGFQFKYTENPAEFTPKPRNVNRKGEKRSLEFGKKLSQILKGRKVSEEVRGRMSKAKKGVKISKHTKSIQGKINIARAAFNKKLIVTNAKGFYKEYLSIIECSLDLNLKKGSIATCLCGKRNSLFGYKFTVGEVNGTQTDI